MHLITYLDFLQTSEHTLGEGYQRIADGHPDEADVAWFTTGFAGQCHTHAQALAAILARSDQPEEPAPQRLHTQGLGAARTGPAGLLRDLADLYQLANLVELTWNLTAQAAQANHDLELLQITERCAAETTAQRDWLRMRTTNTAGQTLLVAP